MDDLNFVQGLASYGALGVCCIYFMWKDCTLNKKLTEALSDFTVAVKVMNASVAGSSAAVIDGVVGNGSV